MNSTRDVPFCPSAQTDWDGSVAIGVVEGTANAPRLVHFSSALPADQRLVELAAPVTPAEVFRFAAPCMGDGCVHFADRRCGLVTQIVQLLPKVTGQLPICSIRSHCKWWQQDGKEACFRCPQVVTDNFNASSEMRAAATPCS